jgi:hypothetical protein
MAQWSTQQMNKLQLVLLCALFSGLQHSAKADFFGGDLPMLGTIVANTAAQLKQLETIVGTNSQTLELLKDVNRGIQDAIEIVKSSNTTLSAGQLSDLTSADQVLAKIQTLYGQIPNTAQAPSQAFVDKTVAESIHLHNEAFRYADKLDPEVERLKQASQLASPGASQKITAQSIGVLTHAITQVLRTNAAMLKIQSEQLALSNKKEKQNSHDNIAKYLDAAKAYMSFKPSYDLPRLGGRK